jgi:hypothetical protein
MALSSPTDRRAAPISARSTLLYTIAPQTDESVKVMMAAGRSIRQTGRQVQLRAGWPDR